jgi:methionyl-tRNA formyltransferase
MTTAHAVALVITRPDQPAGRGLRPAPSAVKRIANEHGLELLQPSALADAQALERLHGTRPDALVVAAYGALLPRVVLEAARFGAINIHASLLPRWRGAAPIQRALLAGDGETGVSIMKMDEGLDTGPLYLQRRLAIEPQEDAGTLHDKLAALGADALVDVLAQLEHGEALARPQPESGATYARKIDKAETRLDWTRPAAELERAIRAFRPSPGAVARLEGKTLKLWRAHVVEARGAPGSVLSTDDFTVACGENALRIEELQPAGRRRMSAQEFLRGHPLSPGTPLR